MQSNSQQAFTGRAELGYSLGAAVTCPWCERRGQEDTACIYRVFPRPKPYSCSHLWPHIFFFFLTVFPGLPSGASDSHISIAERNLSVSTGPAVAWCIPL